VLAASWGRAGRAVGGALRDARRADVVRRIWDRDPTLWSDEEATRATIRDRLGWLAVADWSRARLEELEAFRRDAERFLRVVLCGMGGSSLAPEVISRVYGVDEARLGGERRWRTDLVVLDSTDPTEVRAVEERLHPERTLVIVASKSGSTVETRAHAAYLLERTGDPARFVAVTDPGSPLEALARERGFARVFLNPPDVGGRFSALSHFGLVPSVATGVEVAALLDAATEALDACRRPDDGNPGLQLGVALGELARRGRDKVTFVSSPGLEPFGAWAEQLLAESTGKRGTGIVPVDGEPLGPPEVYGPDRVFVHLRLAGSSAHVAALAALERAGHPVVEIRVASAADLGAQFFLWEFAVAVAGWRLGINPFDEPNVAESKENTARLLDAYAREGRLPEEEPVAGEEGLLLYDDAGGDSITGALARLFRSARPGRYLAVQAFLPRTPQVEEALAEIRTLVRDARRAATMVGFGPRYLHSTGQLHKGGPETGVFLQLTAAHPFDLPVPGAPYTFGTLQAAQAAGDLAALRRRGRRIVRVHLAEGVERGLPALVGLVRRALGPGR
jgi:glucose-6-phosphate isomerase